ncbi:MAG: methyltransferase [Deltaproteobacteria bacterium]|nr:methyltransferase [Deltaproteobacteria bacterium]
MPDFESTPPLRNEAVEKIGPYTFSQEGTGQRLTQDPMLLADFALPLKKEDSVMDIGTGAGVIPLLLAWKSAVSEIVGVEIDGLAAELAVRNVEENRLASRIRIVKRDFRDLKEEFSEGSFSLVVSNPPYIKKGSGRVSPGKERAIARSEVHGELKELLAISKYLIGKGGRVCYVFPVARLFEMLKEVREAGLKARRLRFIHTSPKKAAKLFLIEAGYGGELFIEEPVYLPGC